ncbi:PQQ-dependent sugar dehydrogenase [Roseiconus nitratireducens]|nr:PQQ-dependent sugar dehydrogenase [Roseiconus nitratireducens]
MFPVKQCFFACAVLLLVAATARTADADRTPWTSSRVTGTPDLPRDYRVRRVFPKLQFTAPVELMMLGGTGRMAVLESSGRLHTFEIDGDPDSADLAGELRTHVDKFQSALGFGVHPQFDQNRQVFLVYTRGQGSLPDGTRLSRFRMTDANPPQLDFASEEIVLTWHSGGHNGSAIRFDHRGLLYFSAGDGATPFPPDEFDVSQDLSDLRSTICRIDVDHSDGDRGYTIPADNPFVDLPGARGEIWAYGFRNPWRFDLIPGTDRILCGDVGWELWELVFEVRRGGNYGWSLFEGPQRIRSDLEQGPTPIQKPVVAYPHTVGQSITGGLVYRGTELPSLRDAFLYGDWVTGRLWGLRHDESGVTWNPVLAETGLQITSFAQRPDGEVLVLSYDGGIYQLEKNPLAGKTTDFPRKLSETGLFRSTRSLQPSPGVIPYQIAAQAYQDGARGEFVIGIPGNGSAVPAARWTGWKFPAGTVFAKTISLESFNDGQPTRRRVETQLLHFDGLMWHPYSYAWNPEQTDAALVDAAGETLQVSLRDADGQLRSVDWTISNRAQCQTCHKRWHGGGIGFKLENLSLDSDSQSSSQLRQLIELGVLNEKRVEQFEVRAMVDPHDSTADLDRRARSYLTANCAHCHRREGGGTAPLELVFSKQTSEINAVGETPTQGDFGITGANVIRPGDPYHSVLFYRMATSGPGHMPKLWQRDNDLAGLRLIHDWIASMPNGETTADSASTDAVASALREFSELAFGDADAERQTRVARSAAEQGDLIRAALLERFLPPDERKKRLGDAIEPDAILALDGNAASGRELLMDSKALQCLQCHRVAGAGKSTGPDLDGLGKKRSKQQLLDSILNPSRQVEAEYRTRTVLTRDGEVISGLVVRQTDSEVVIRSADGKDHPIDAADIETIKEQSESLMPTGQVAQLTAQELADLLEYLSTL